MIRIEKVIEERQIFAAMEQSSLDFYDTSIDRIALSSKIAKYGNFLVGYEHDELAGFVGYYSNDTKTHTAYLTTIVVSGKHRGKGVGNTLLQACFDDCRNKGMIKCRLEVRKDNQRAIRFYSSRGFSKEANASRETDFYICELSKQSEKPIY